MIVVFDTTRNFGNKFLIFSELEGKGSTRQQNVDVTVSALWRWVRSHFKVSEYSTTMVTVYTSEYSNHLVTRGLDGCGGGVTAKRTPRTVSVPGVVSLTIYIYTARYLTMRLCWLVTKWVRLEKMSLPALVSKLPCGCSTSCCSVDLWILTLKIGRPKDPLSTQYAETPFLICLNWSKK